MKTKLKYIAIASLLFVAGGFNSAKAITADELLATIVVPVYQFVIDTFSVVGQVLVNHNARIMAQESASAANATLITNLQAQVDAIATQNVGLDGGDLTGSIYCFINLGSELTGGASPGVYSSHSNGVLTFTSSTQLSLLDGGDVDAFLNTNTGVNGTGSSTGGTSTIFSYSLNGNIVTIFGIRDDGGNNFYYLTPDANLLVGDNAGLSDAGNNHEADFLVAVRADSC